MCKKNVFILVSFITLVTLAVSCSPESLPITEDFPEADNQESQENNNGSNNGGGISNQVKVSLVGAPTYGVFLAEVKGNVNGVKNDVEVGVVYGTESNLNPQIKQKCKGMRRTLYRRRKCLFRETKPS